MSKIRIGMDKDGNFKAPLITEEQVRALGNTDRVVHDSGPILRGDEDIISRLVQELDSAEWKQMADEAFATMSLAGIL